MKVRGVGGHTGDRPRGPGCEDTRSQVRAAHTAQREPHAWSVLHPHTQDSPFEHTVHTRSTHMVHTRNSHIRDTSRGLSHHPHPSGPHLDSSLAWGPHGTVCSAALREIQAAWKRRCFPGTFPPPSLTACSTHIGTCARTRTCSSCSRHTQAHVRTHTHTYIVLDTHTQAHVYRHAHTHILL